MKRLSLARRLTAFALMFVLLFSVSPLTVAGFLPDGETQAYEYDQEYVFELPDEFIFSDSDDEVVTLSIANSCAFCVVENMGPGWNLGNTFDATHIGHSSSCSRCIPNSSSPPGGSSGTGIWNCGFSQASGRRYSTDSAGTLEGAWIGGSSNTTTQQLIRNVRNAGFTTIRIPVTWYKATSGPPN